MKLITNMQSEEYLEIGIISSTHKLNGEVKIKFYSKEDVLQKYESIYVIKNGMYTKIKINKRSAKNSNVNLIIASIEEIKTQEEAQSYKGKKLYIKKEEIQLQKEQKQNEIKSGIEEIEDEDIYIADLIGMDVIYKNENIGKIQDVLTNVPTEIFVIKSDKLKDKLNNSNQILVPYIEKYVKEIDLKSKKCIVDISELV